MLSLKWTLLVLARISRSASALSDRKRKKTTRTTRFAHAKKAKIMMNESEKKRCRGRVKVRMSSAANEKMYTPMRRMRTMSCGISIRGRVDIAPAIVMITDMPCTKWATVHEIVTHL